MWMAFRVPEKANENYTLAAAALKQVIESGKYELNPSFTTLWDPGAVLDQGVYLGTKYSTKVRSGTAGVIFTDAHTWHTYFSACPSVGGWGSLYLFLGMVELL